MIKIGQYIPFHLSIFLTLGIVLGYYVETQMEILFGVIFALSWGIILTYFGKNKVQKIIFQIIAYLLIGSLGWLITSFQLPINQKNHFQHFYSENKTLVLQINEILKPTPFQDKYIVKILRVEKQLVKGQFLLNVRKDSARNKMKVGQVFETKISLKEIPKALNPHTFDYASYMQKQGVFHQGTLAYDKLQLLPIGKISLSIWAQKVRTKIQEKLMQYPFGKDELGIINAILLGDKQFISKDLQGNYAAAGAVHILAVSGLHVGVLFLILSYVFYPLQNFKQGKMLSGIIIILLLWGFALIAGMSGSVVRAVTMFSFITAGMLFRSKKSPVLHALFTSFFLLLFIQPLFLFDVGFQLSYMAVLGIVLFQSKIYALIPNIKWEFFRKLWQLVCVSLAATLATLPLSLFYFHQFPGLFIISNVIIVPAMGIVLGLGLLIIFLSVLNSLPSFLVLFYNKILLTMNFFVDWIAHQESFLFREIPFSLALVVALFITIAMGYRWMIDLKYTKFFSFALSVLLVQSVFIFEKWQVKNNREWVVFHKSKETLLGFKKGENLQILHSAEPFNLASYMFLKNYKIGEKIDSLTFEKQKYNVLNFGEKKILVIDSLGIYQQISFKPHFILLTQSPKINLDRLLSHLHPEAVIADGSNYSYMVEKWELTCQKNQTPFHYTGKKGAYILKN